MSVTGMTPLPPEVKKAAIETTERIVIDYANLSGRESENRGEFRELTEGHLDSLLSRVISQTREETELVLNPYLAHEKQCVVETIEAGRPTSDGGYEQKYAGKWYRATPVDETPKCDCGLLTALEKLKSTSYVRKSTTRDREGV